MALTRITKGVIKPNENYQAGIVTATGLDVNGNGDISGDLNVGGILTYEDVTSIDAVGIITAQKGIHVGAGISAVGVGTFNGLVSPYADIDDFLDVGSNIQLGNAGVVTATTFVGNLTGNVTGNADTATTTERVTLTNQGGDSTCNVLFAQSATGNQLPHTNANLTFNATNGRLTATSFAGDGSNLTGITQTTINNNADNRVITGSGTANT